MQGDCRTMKLHGWNARRMLGLVGMVVLAGALVFVSGCGKKPEAETDPDQVIVEPVEMVQPVPEPVVPEVPVAPAPALDYTTMHPSEYGVEDVFFAFDRYDLDDRALAVLGRNARILKEHPEVIILIEGHCDERGTVEYNLALGEKRAKTVRDHLVRLGVAGHRLRVTSYGESRPFALGSNEAAWAQNRRAHFARP